jgi:hypothetical protein
MLTTTGSPIRHAHDILALLNAVLLPKEVLVIHYRGHQKGEDNIAKGTNWLMKQLNGQACRII